MSNLLAKYLLNYEKGLHRKVRSSIHAPAEKYSDEQLQIIIQGLLKKIAQLSDQALAAYKTYQQTITGLNPARQLKKSLLEDNQVYDKYVLAILKEFCNLAIAFLKTLQDLHKNKIFHGNINPYNFTYNRKQRECGLIDKETNLAANNKIKNIKQKHGNFKYILIHIWRLKYNRYLAPEFKKNILVYALIRELNSFFKEADSRGLDLENTEYINDVLSRAAKTKIKYSNKAEIYSLGYSLNQILSHMLEKIACLGLTVNQFPKQMVDEKYVDEADLLLPNKFNNPERELVIALLNKVVGYVYALMHENISQRDSIAVSIEKFSKILEKIESTTPGTILEKEEEEDDEEEAGEKKEEAEEEESEEEEAEEEEAEEEEAEEEEAEEEEAEEEEAEEEEAEEEEAEEEEAEEEEAEEEEAEEEEEESEEEEVEEEEEESEEEEAEEEEEVEEEEEESEEEEAEEEEHEHEEHEHEEHEHEEHEHEEHEHEEHEHEEHEHEEHEHEEHEHKEHEHEEHEHEEHEHHLDEGHEEADQHTEDEHPQGPGH